MTQQSITRRICRTEFLWSVITIGMDPRRGKRAFKIPIVFSDVTRSFDRILLNFWTTWHVVVWCQVDKVKRVYSMNLPRLYILHDTRRSSIPKQGKRPTSICTTLRHSVCLALAAKQVYEYNRTTMILKKTLLEIKDYYSGEPLLAFGMVDGFTFSINQKCCNNSVRCRRCLAPPLSTSSSWHCNGEIHDQ